MKIDAGRLRKRVAELLLEHASECPEGRSHFREHWLELACQIESGGSVSVSGEVAYFLPRAVQDVAGAFGDIGEARQILEGEL